ncbi:MULTISPECIES: DUF3105 domain-containing protein [unclassified Phycicoccus]|uniref:DUF3105 domain-containing protein n=1 Tax=unclassified Phycicoccus TaxID=2637926 RepID=UPI0007035866|nr:MULTISPECIES: DUF3105 domain-containing protein [unclassified Phycicoccus]KQU69405.1 hypothetical protein ASC58_05870 [Phycicoccus sp. Root101]KQZ90616.1 hypothetical protein ASD62_16330 [Phycicoccus sp. Root563]
MSNKRASQDRKARLAEIQNQQKAKERKVKAGIGAGLVVLLVGLGGVVFYAINDAKSKQLPNLGVSVAAASCDAPTTDSGGGTGEHVGPGTNKPDETSVKYDTIPPSHGPHFVAPDVSGRDFYTAADRPALETLVHNLEHGYTVLWYDGSKVKDTTLLKDVADQGNKLSDSSGKFKVVEWDASRGAFPAGKPYALVHWAKDAGHRQLCGDLSGQAVVDFVKKYPASDTQEPGAQ